MRNKVILERRNGKIRFSTLNKDAYSANIVSKILNYKNLDKMLHNVVSDNIDCNFNVIYDVDYNNDVKIIAVSKI